MDSEIVLLSGNANRPLAESIADLIGDMLEQEVGLGNIKVGTFADGEIYVEIDENVRGRDVFIIQPTSKPGNDHLMELLIMVDACKRASAGRLTAVIPYYGYARQDRKVASRAPITAKLVADMLSTAGVTRVLTMDLHAGQIQGFFDVPVDNLYASILMGRKIESLRSSGAFKSNDIVVVSPDTGGVPRARQFAEILGADLAIIDKRRLSPNDPNGLKMLKVIGDVSNKTAIMLDDMVDTAGTLCKAAGILKSEGAVEVYACCTHPVLSSPLNKLSAVDRINSSNIESLFVTDTIQLSAEAQQSDRIEVVTVGPLFAKAIVAIHKGTSISTFFEF